MRRVFERVTDRLRGFIGQRDYVGLVVTCPAEASPVIVKTLEGLDDESTSELFWIIVDDFEDPDGYVDTVIDQFRTRHDAVRAVQAQEGQAVWPELPAAVADPNAPADERLRELMIFSRSLLPTLEGGLVVWVFFPLQVLDPRGYGRLMSGILRHDFPFPWCHHMRVIAREDAAAPALEAALAPLPAIDYYTPDVSTEALQQALEDDVDDEQLPLEERMQAVLMTASTDYSYGRYEQALEKYQLLFQYYQATNRPDFAALALNGAGEIHQALGDWEKAGGFFESALGPATATNPLSVVLLNTLLNLANLRLAEERWDEAEAYYDNADKLATLFRNAPTKIQALENRGYAEYAQGKVEQAVETWELASHIASELNEPKLRRSILERLHDHWTHVGNNPRARAVDEEMSTLPEPDDEPPSASVS
jgi:tetratricopeptide (TPR) repeat protein